MLKTKLNLQLFADGGGASGSGTGSDGIAGSNVGSAEAGNGMSEPSEVIYGKQENGLHTGSDAESKGKRVSFDDLIKGEYKEDFEKRTQKIIDKRFKETKGLKEQIAKHDNIMSMLSSKYGVDSADTEALLKAIEEDDSFYEEEAFEKGLTIKQLKEVKRLERENEQLKRAEEEQKRRTNSERIYSEWMNQAEQLKTKYGLDNFSMEEEVKNPDFTRLLENGVGVETAYKAVHMDQMIGGAMAKTASEVAKGIANNIQSRQSRPSENGLSTSSASQIFKSDPSTFTDSDMREIRKRALRGERIVL